MKSQDIYILFKLVCLHQNSHASASDHFSARGLSAALGVSKSEVNASIRRSIDVGLAIKDRKSGYPKANRQALLEFVVHGLKYVFPAKPAEITRGVPTAFSAPMLQTELSSVGDFIPVWPYAESEQKGQAVSPLFKTVPKAVLHDEQLYELLALTDAIRLGNPRESKLAVALLKKRLLDD